MAFELAMSLNDLWDGEIKGICLQGQKILLVHCRGTISAFADRCPHLGVALSEGRLSDGSTLTCRAHGWSFDAISGDGLNPTGTRLKKIPVELRGSDILVDVYG